MTHGAPQFSVALMELGATVCTARVAAVRAVPAESRARGGRRDSRPATGPAATDAEATPAPTGRCADRLLDVLRGSASPVTRAELDVAWLTDTAQRDRALDSLLVDGLVEQTADGRFALCGEGDAT